MGNDKGSNKLCENYLIISASWQLKAILLKIVFIVEEMDSNVKALPNTGYLENRNQILTKQNDHDLFGE